MKHKIGVIEGCSNKLTSVKQGVKVLEAIARNTNLRFDLRYIKVGSKPNLSENGNAFKEAAENCKALDAVLVMDDIENDQIKELNISGKAASTALQYELETSLFDTLDKYPVIFDNQIDDSSVDVSVKPIGAMMSVARLLDYVGYKRFGDKVRFAAFEAAASLKSNDKIETIEEEDQFTDLVVEYIDKNVSEPMISAWGEI